MVILLTLAACAASSVQADVDPPLGHGDAVTPRELRKTSPPPRPARPTAPVRPREDSIDVPAGMIGPGSSASSGSAEDDDASAEGEAPVSGPEPSPEPEPTPAPSPEPDTP